MSGTTEGVPSVSIADSAAGRHSDDTADRRCISETEKDFRAIPAGRWARLVKLL